jgi:hypothetical protein
VGRVLDRNVGVGCLKRSRCRPRKDQDAGAKKIKMPVAS